MSSSETRPLPRTSSMAPCPDCGGEGFNRSRRRGLERLLSALFGVFPYRCADCGTRVYRVRPSGK